MNYLQLIVLNFTVLSIYPSCVITVFQNIFVVGYVQETVHHMVYHNLLMVFANLCV